MNIIRKGFDLSLKITKFLMILLMAIMVASMFLQVVTRYMMGSGFTWTEELARFSNVWLVFLGSSFLIFYDDHIKVTILDEMLKEKGMIVVNAIRNVIYLLYSFVLIKAGLGTLSIVSKQTSPNMLIPMNYIYIAIPLCGIIGAIYIIYNNTLNRKGENNG